MLQQRSKRVKCPDCGFPELVKASTNGRMSKPRHVLYCPRCSTPDDYVKYMA